jgi:hypothetical protein
VGPDRVHRHIELTGNLRCGKARRQEAQDAGLGLAERFGQVLGDDDLVFIETFRSDHYEEVSLASWLSHLPSKLVSAHLNIPEETLAKFPRGAQGIVPLP